MSSLYGVSRDFSIQLEIRWNVALGIAFTFSQAKDLLRFVSTQSGQASPTVCGYTRSFVASDTHLLARVSVLQAELWCM